MKMYYEAIKNLLGELFLEGIIVEMVPVPNRNDISFYSV
jgi:hypothetical protein